MTRLVRTVASRKRLTVAGIVVVFLAAAMLAGAYFSSTGSGTGSANAGSLNAPTNVTVPATSSGTVHVTWTASVTGAGFATPTGYYVERNGGSGWTAACSSSPSSLVSGTSCDDTVSVDGDYFYRATAVFNSWTATSAQSATSVHVATDTTPPYVLSINRDDPSPTNSGAVHWTVTFSENVTGVDASDFALVASGVSGASITTVAGSGAMRSVTASTGSGDGTLGLNLVDDDSIVDGSGNPLGTSGGAGDGSFTGQVYAIDKTAPTVSSINRADASPTNAGTVHWTVTFSAPVTGVDATDFALVRSGVTGGSVTTVTGTGPYTVTATTGSGDGTLGLNLVDDDSIVDAAGNPLGGTGTSGAGDGSFTGQVYTIDKTAPTVSTINRAAGSTNPTNTGPLAFTVTFSEPVNTAAVVGARFAVTTTNVTGTAPTVGTITPISPSGGFASIYTVNVTTTGAVGADNGSVRLDLTTGGTIQDQATNGLAGTPHNGDQSFTFDTTAPTVSTINRAAGSTNPTNTGPLAFTVTFSEPVNTAAVVGARFAVTTTNVTGTAPTVGTITPISPSGGFASIYTVNVTTTGAVGADNGSVRLDLTTGGTIQDQATNGLAGTPHNGDQSFTFDTTAPTVSTINRAAGSTNPTNTGPLAFTVTFSEPVNTAAVVGARFAVTTTNVTGTAPTVGTITPISPSGGFASIYTVNVTTTGAVGADNGSVRLDQASSGTIADQAGNGLSGTHNGDQSYNYDTTAPTVSTINIAGTSPTNATTLPFTVTFSEPVNTAGVVAARFAVTTANVTGTAPTVGAITPVSPSGGFATSYTVNVNATGAVGANNGSVRLDLTSVGTIQDQATNALTAVHNGDQSYNYDTTAPTVSTINIAGTSPTKAATLPFTVTFSEPVNTAAVVAARFAVTTSGVTGTAPTVGTITPVSPSGGFATSYTVNVNATGAIGANSGSVRLDLTTAGTIQDQATNGLAGTPHNGDQSYNYDTTAPTVSTINIAGTSPTNATTLPFTVTFSEPVNTAAVVAARFAVTTSGVTGTAPTVGTITPVSPSGGFATSYTVNVNATGAIGANNGSVRLDQTSSGTIADQAGNGLTGTHNGDQTYNYDTTAPTVTINQAAGQADPTAASPINFTVVFTESTTDFATGDVTLAGTAGVTTATVTGSGTTYNVAVTGMTTNGTVIATLGAGVAHDAAGNANTASTSTDNTVTYQNVLTPTAVTITNGTGGTAGKAEAGDVITITWNRAIQLSSVCSSWSSDSQTVTGVTVTMNRGNGSATNNLTFSSGTVGATACSGAIKIGAMNTTASGYEPNNTSPNFNNSTVTWNATTNQLVITLGTPDNQPPGTVASSTYTYTPTATIAASGGSPTATGTASTGSVQNF